MVLLIVAIFTGLILFGIGLLLNEKNAPSMLSGYNSMSKEEQQQVRLKEYVAFFRKFHFFIGSMIVILSIIFYLVKLHDYIGYTLIVFSLPGYTFFIYKSQFYFPPQQKSLYKVVSFVMLILTLGVILMMVVFQFNPKIEIFDNQIRISGVYGENIPLQNIEEVQLLEELPPIKMKLNGIAMSKLKKGWFRLQNGEKVKLFVNDKSGPYVLIKTLEQKTIIIGLNDFDDSLLYEQLILQKK